VSSFRPTYNLAVNLVRRYPVEQAHDILEQSFAQFRDRRHRHALSRRLDAALRLLDRWGHVELGEWRLTERGIVLARIYHESDLLVAEALAEGVFDGLAPRALAGAVSGCSYEARAGRLALERRPPKHMIGALGRLEALAERLRDDEESHHLPRTRRVDSRLAGAVGAWAGGERLERVLERAELPPGDFVRNAKQLIDLLRQLATVAPVRATGQAAAAAAVGLERGVVAASSGPALEEESEDVDLAGDELAGGSDEASAAAEDQHSGGVGLH
jgi:ATP-dependent RNA helicase HelY